TGQSSRLVVGSGDPDATVGCRLKGRPRILSAQLCSVVGERRPEGPGLSDIPPGHRLGCAARRGVGCRMGIGLVVGKLVERHIGVCGPGYGLSQTERSAIGAKVSAEGPVARAMGSRSCLSQPA